MGVLMSAGELRGRLTDPGLALVDVRPMSAYNGWRLGGATRGGHVPGAVALPSAWLNSLDDTQARQLLAAKGVVANRELVLYGDSTEDVSAVGARLEILGYTNVRVYEYRWAEWAADVTSPTERLTNYDRLVHTAWLKQVIDGARPEAAPSGRFLVFHVNFGVREEYEENHIPGALYLDTGLLERPDDWNRRSSDELDAALCSLGVRWDTTVILYGRDSEGDANERWPGRRAGQIAATRAALIMRYCGVEDVRLLDGGYDAWVRGGNPLETTPRAASPVDSFGARVPAHPEVIVDIDEAKQILSDPNAALVSVRTWAEQVGQASGYRYIGVVGRIAGDVWAKSGSDAYHMEHYRNLDNTMRPYPEIASAWEDVGITAAKRLAFYCGTGWRSSEAWFYAYLMGWPRIAVYDGGWYEWSQDPQHNPIEVGQI